MIEPMEQLRKKIKRIRTQHRASKYMKNTAHVYTHVLYLIEEVMENDREWRQEDPSTDGRLR